MTDFIFIVQMASGIPERGWDSGGWTPPPHFFTINAVEWDIWMDPTLFTWVGNPILKSPSKIVNYPPESRCCGCEEV